MSQARVRNDFSKVLDAYKKYRRDYPQKVYDFIVNFCPDPESKILDIGCGTGIVSNHLACFYKNVTGTDKKKEMIETAKNNRKDNTTFVMAGAEKLPFEDGTFDLVTAGTSYHWFDYDSAGKEIYRILKPQGKMCVFWKADNGYSKNYLPNFACGNLTKFVHDIPKANKELISEQIFYRVGFGKVNKLEFDFDEIYSKEQILGHIQSHSTYNLLDDMQKTEYMALNSKTVDEYLSGNNFVFYIKMVMYFVDKPVS